jgi:putative oxidoreductase
MNRYAELAGRILMSLIFLAAGMNKITGYAGTQGYMESMGVPGILLPLVILVELAGAVALILGYRTRLFAFLLAGFCVLSGALFHNNFANQMDMIMFMKNLAMAGGFLVLFAHGAGELSLDKKLGKGSQSLGNMR